jgi:hypothetical protein
MGYSSYECLMCYEFTRYNVLVSENLKYNSIICLDCCEYYKYILKYDGFYSPEETNDECHCCCDKNGEKLYISLCKDHVFLQRGLF